MEKPSDWLGFQEPCRLDMFDENRLDMFDEN
jgi:hypothetical protein